MGNQDLQTASSYINNALICRGLLRKGEEIEWAQPKNHPAGTGGTMVKIIRLVNDLIVDRDRDEQHRESLADAIQKVRSSEQKRGVEIGRLQARNKELERSLSLSKNQENALRESAKKATTTIRDLQSQINRYKSDLNKAHAKYANDNSRRDLDIGKLRRQLVELQRSKKEGYGLNIRQGNAEGLGQLGKGVKGFDDKAQTNAVLAEQLDIVCREAEALGLLVKDTIRELKRMTDFRSTGKAMHPAQVEDSQSYCLGSFDVLSGEVLAALTQCRSVLEDPSFVSVESVEGAFKEQESYIKELRSGWEMMANRLRQTQEMMAHWKERMKDGESINLNDLGTGLQLGESVMPPLYEESILSSLSTAHVASSVGEIEMPSPYEKDGSGVPQSVGVDELSQVSLDEEIFEQGLVGFYDGGKLVDGQSHGLKARSDTEENVRTKFGPNKSQENLDDERAQMTAQCYRATSPPKRGINIKKEAAENHPSPTPISGQEKKLFNTSPKHCSTPKFSINSDDASLLSLRRSEESSSAAAEARKKASGPGVFTRLSQPKSKPSSRAASASKNPSVSSKKPPKPAKKQTPLFPGISPLKSGTKVNVSPAKPLSISEKLAAAKQEAEEAENANGHLDLADTRPGSPGHDRPTNIDAASHEAYDEWKRAAIGEEGDTLKRNVGRGMGKRRRGRGRKSTLSRAELDSLLFAAVGESDDKA